MNTPTKIVLRVESNVLYRMKADDMRLTNPLFEGNYAVMGDVTALNNAPKVADNGHKYQTAICSNGKCYGIFSDWSARELESEA
jgi:hypothetical protein